MSAPAPDRRPWKRGIFGVLTWSPQFAADDQPANLRGAGADLQKFAGAIEPVDPGLPHVAGAAEYLHLSRPAVVFIENCSVAKGNERTLLTHGGGAAVQMRLP